MAGPSNSEGKIMEGDNLQNYGRKDQCIYIIMCYKVQLNLGFLDTKINLFDIWYISKFNEPYKYYVVSGMHIKKRKCRIKIRYGFVYYADHHLKDSKDKIDVWG